jgi:DNA-directed RNA polymerase specialized sigma24 family protein
MARPPPGRGGAVMVAAWVVTMARTMDRPRPWPSRRAEHPTGAMPDCEAAGDLAAEVTARMAVRSALGSLTARQRAVLVLRVFDDLSEAQVAQVPDCAVGTEATHLTGPPADTPAAWPLRA